MKSVRVKFNQTLHASLFLPRHASIFIAISGGQDSLCLGHLLKTLQPKWQWQLAIGHCNHQWRTDATQNAVHVQEIATAWEIPFYQRTATIPPSTESRARNWRYAMLTEMAEMVGATIVVTGHTLTDRAETLLLNLFRGTGIEGMQSLYWKRSLAPGIELVRPLLGISREQTAQYCAHFQLPVWHDSTNADTTHSRNRMRLELFPYLKKHFNPQVEVVLAQTAEIFQGESSFLAASTQEIWQREGLANALPRIDRRPLQSYTRSVQRRLIRYFLALHLPRQLAFGHIEKVVDLIEAPNRSQCDPLPGKAHVEVLHPWLWLRFDTVEELHIPT